MASLADHERANEARLSRLLIDKGTEAMRNVFDSIHPPATLTATLNSHRGFLKKLPFINSSQMDIVFPLSGAPSQFQDFDITLLFILLRNICALHPPVSTGKWDANPPSTDTTQEANLARIKYYRNKVYGHIAATGVDDANFNSYWNDISAAVVGLGVSEGDVKLLKFFPLEENFYLDHITEWKGKEDKLEVMLNKSEQNQKEIVGTLKDALENQEKMSYGQETVLENQKIVLENQKKMSHSQEAFRGYQKVVLENQKDSVDILKAVSQSQEALLKNQKALFENSRETCNKLGDTNAQLSFVSEQLKEVLQEAKSTTHNFGKDKLTNTSITTSDGENVFGENAAPDVKSVDLKDVKLSHADWAYMSNQPINVLLHTTDDVEFLAAATIISNPKRVDSGSQLGIIYFGDTGANKVALIKSFKGALDSTGTQATCSAAIEILKPKVVVSLGVCSGMKREKHDLGDVLVSSQVAFYGPSRVNTDSTVNALGPIIECDPKLKSLFDSGKLGWSGAKKEFASKVHHGQVVCVSQDNNSQLMADLKRRFPEAVGVETEGEGLYAICRNAGVPWILCKSISNWDDGSVNSMQCRKLGAASSASYVEHILKKSYVTEKKPETQSALPQPFLPDMVPYFTGRQEEYETIVGHMTGKSTQLVTIWGPPGFGKTSVAIAVGHRLQRQDLPVYFFSLRNVKSLSELQSKLYNCFAPTIKASSQPLSHSEILDELCYSFRSISSDVFIILDNADDILESGGADARQEFEDFFQEILMRSKNLTILCTTRMNLEFLDYKFQGHESVKIGPMQETNSYELTRHFLTDASDKDCLKIVRVCGRVPLAIRLLCSLIAADCDQPGPYVDEFCKSTDEVLELLNDPDLSSNLRLKTIFESSFKRLSQQEKEVLVSLSVFVGETFDLDAAANIIGGRKTLAKQTLQRIKRKGLIDQASKSSSCTFHPLIKAFTNENGKNELKQVVSQAQTRFSAYYVSIFKDLNKQFLSGDAFDAFCKFCQEKENIFEALNQGLSNEAVFNEMFAVLCTAELLLTTISCSGFDCLWGVVNIYDETIKKLKERQDFENISQLLVSKAFIEFLHKKTEESYQTFNEAGEIEANIPADTPKAQDAKGKKMCYEGMFRLSDGSAQSGLLEKGLSLLSNSDEARVLKVFGYQILHFHFRAKNDSDKCDRFSREVLNQLQHREDLSLIHYVFTREVPDSCYNFVRQPLVWLSMIIMGGAIDPIPSKDANFQALCDSLLEKIELKLKNDITLLPCLRLISNMLTMLDSGDGQSSLLRALELTKNKCGELNHQTASMYINKGDQEYRTADLKSALSSYQRSLDVRLKLFGEEHIATAESYRRIGNAQHKMGDYKSALQSKNKELNIQLKLFGEEKTATADSYNSIGETQSQMGDDKCALQSYEKELKIRLKLSGEEYTLTANSYYEVGAIKFQMRDHKSALKSFGNALKIRLKLLGEENEATADSYHSVGATQHEMGDYKSALQSNEKALKIRLKLFGEEHAETPDSYYSIGVTQHEMGDYKSALQLKEKALDIRLKLFGDYHVTIADSYCNIGVTQCEIGDYRSALQSHEKSLNIRRKLFGEEHATTALSYREIGLTQNAMGDYKSALQSHEKALNIRLKLFGEEHATTADSYFWIGVTQCEVGDHKSISSSIT